MKEEWRTWRLTPHELAELRHEFDVPAVVERFEEEWCAGCPHADEGMMCLDAGAILGGTDAESRWLLEWWVDGRLAARYCLRHPQPPQFREPECIDLFMLPECEMEEVESARRRQEEPR